MLYIRLITFLSVILVSGCANLNTISRTNNLGGVFGFFSGQDTAIHLDAQQRLVLSRDNMKKVCAEPSPDAMAAYAASLAFGASVPGQGAGSAAAGGQNSAASIGLRTQSITLMRDALYRVCEASMNEEIGPVQVATLLGRGMDLTAVILAVEQLTGAVAANQAILTGSTSASAAAALISNQELLDAARNDENEKRKALEKAETDLEVAETAVTTQQGIVYGKQREYDAADAERKKELKAGLEASKTKLITLEDNKKAAENQVENKQIYLAEAEKNRQTIENLKDSAFTNAVATTNTSGQFSIPVQRKQLSDKATEKIAQSVENMVSAVLNKRYTEESCVAYLGLVQDGAITTGSLKDECLNLIKARVIKETSLLK